MELAALGMLGRNKAPPRVPRLNKCQKSRIQLIFTAKNSGLCRCLVFNTHKKKKSVGAQGDAAQVRGGNEHSCWESSGQAGIQTIPTGEEREIFIPGKL